MLVATLQQALTIFYRIGSYLLGFSPAIRIPMFDSPPKHLRSSVVKVCHANYFMKFNVTFTGLRSLKGRGLPGLNRRPFDPQSKALPLSYILVKVASWLLHNSKYPPFPILFFCFGGFSPTSLDNLLSQWWFRGRILDYYAGDRASILRQCIYDLA